ncbi:MAG TPA: hypothetical protein VFF03_03490 [Rhodocyclaceae bacterium]|nr:hypothetical protein [Rhodocyclaceae bacterium]
MVRGTEGLYPARDEVLDQKIREMGIGSVVGWGDSLGERPLGCSRPVAFHRIDVEVSNLDQGRAALRDILDSLGVPVGTEINFSREGVKVQDVYSPAGWLLDQLAPTFAAVGPKAQL